MYAQLAIAAAAALAGVSAAPLQARQAAAAKPDIDVVILNYALTLEHLENAFYRDSLKTYDQAAFEAAGFPYWVRNRFEEIGAHEQAHVDFLTTALGANATKECTYAFGVTDPKTFAATSQLLEGIGTSAYLGAAAAITNPDYLTAAGSILTVEARHTAWVASAVRKGDAFGKPFDTPLDFNQTYSLAAPLIKSCPSTNPALPVAAFPVAMASNAAPQPGETIEITGDAIKDGQYLAVLSGLQTYFAPINGGKATIPKETGYGRSYGVVTSSNKAVTDDNTVAGPLVFDIPLPSQDAAALYY